MAKRRSFSFGGGGASTFLSLVHPEAIYDLDFARGQYFGATPAQLVTSRSSNALTLTPGGSYVDFPINFPRITGNGLMIEEARTNSIRNPRGSGAAAGVVPTNWSVPVNPVAGVTRTIVGAVTVNGLPGVRVNWTGTPTATTNAGIVSFEGSTAIPAAVSQSWVASAGAALAASGPGAVPAFQLDITERDSGGAALVNGAVSFPVSSAFSIVPSSRTLTNASTAFVFHRLLAGFQNGVAVDFTLDIAAPIIRQASFAGSPILNADGVTSSATTQPADVVYLPISGVGTECTIFAETGSFDQPSASNTIVNVSAGASDNNRLIVRRSTTSTLIGSMVNAGVASGNATTVNTVSASLPTKSGVSFSSSVTRSCVAGGTVGTATPATAVPSGLDRLYFGVSPTGFVSMNGFIRRIAIIPRALTDAELQTLTT